EKISIETIVGINSDQIDLIVFLADASNLSRNLLLYSQVADLGIPIILALNMMDQATKKNLNIDIELLSKELGVLIYPINARSEIGIEDLKKGIEKNNSSYQRLFFNESKKDIDELSVFETYQSYLLETVTKEKKETKLITSEIISLEIQKRYEIIDLIVQKTQGKTHKINKLTEKLDKILLHPVYGFIAFYATLFVLFQMMFKLADYPATWIENGFSSLTTFLSSRL